MSVPNTEQNDPSELLEVFDALGNPTGRAKPRNTIHLNGDWHQAFHCWILRSGPHGTEIVLQRRALTKDTFPGRWDASAAGHWRFGETAEQASREIAEELGIEVPFDRLTWRGRERTARRHASGLVDREHHQVYVVELNQPLSTYRPDPREVSGVAAVNAGELIALTQGKQPSIRTVEAYAVDGAGELAPIEAAISLDDLVPYSPARLRRLLPQRSRAAAARE